MTVPAVVSSHGPPCCGCACVCCPPLHTRVHLPAMSVPIWIWLVDSGGPATTGLPDNVTDYLDLQPLWGGPWDVDLGVPCKSPDAYDVSAPGGPPLYSYPDPGDATVALNDHLSVVYNKMAPFAGIETRLTTPDGWQINLSWDTAATMKGECLMAAGNGDPIAYSSYLSHARIGFLRPRVVLLEPPPDPLPTSAYYFIQSHPRNQGDEKPCGLYAVYGSQDWIFDGTDPFEGPGVFDAARMTGRQFGVCSGTGLDVCPEE